MFVSDLRRHSPGATGWLPRPSAPLPALLIALALSLAVLVASLSALAQTDTAAGQAPAPERVNALIAALEDETQRQALIDQLRLLADAQDQAEEGSPLQSVGAEVLGYLSDQVGSVGDQVSLVALALSDLPQAFSWFFDQAEDPEARDRWLDALIGLALVIGLAVAVRWIALRAMRAPLQRLTDRDMTNIIARSAALLVRAVMEVVPLIAFVVAAYITLSLADLSDVTRPVVIAVLNAALITGVIASVTRIALTPYNPQMRLFKLDNETAAYLYIWLRRLTFTAVYGFFIAEAALVLGLPLTARDALMDFVGLLVALMLVVLVLQNRKPLSALIRGPAKLPGTLGTLRRRLADVWHILALLYIAALYVIWVLAIEGGFEFMVRATALTMVIAGLARLASYGAEKAMKRGFTISPDLLREFPNLEERTNRYVPLVKRGVKLLIGVLTVLALLQVWGLGGLDWLSSDTGRRVVGALVSIGIVLIVSVVLWEGVSNLIERQLNRTDDDGNVIETSARTRTLLPLLRNAFLVVLLTVVTLIVLSEIGVNIAPLLAGAGVIGLAIGFGSQTLVKDVITGLFILFEDSISVGDVVTAGGHTGVVEGITIRTIRLRDLSGTVHTVPFSSVTSVVNMTKDFSYAVIDMGVAYREDTDAVFEVMKEVGAELQADPEFGPAIMEPLEVLGVNSFADSAVMLRARIKTRPIKQWWVGREFNRRIKKRFDELGIEIPFPHTTVYFGEGKDGSAPAARLRMEGPAPRLPAGGPPGLPEAPAAASDPGLAEPPPAPETGRV